MPIKQTQATVLTFCLSLFLWTGLALATDPQTVHIVVAASNPLSSVSRSELISILSLQKRYWDNGERIVILLPPITNPDFSQFVIEHTGLYPYQLQRRWDRSRFAGRGRAPIKVSSPEEALRLLKTTPGALAFLPSRLKDTEVKHVPSLD